MIPTRRTVVAAALATSALGPTLTSAATPGAWTTCAPLPLRTQEIYCTLWRGRIVTAGGLSPDAQGFVSDRTCLYDLATDAWTEGPKLPAPRHHPQIVNFRDRVLSLGGYTFQGNLWHSTTDIFALDGDRWTPAGQLPGPQAETVSAVLDDALHLVGGRAPKGEANAKWDDQGDIDTHRVFDGGAWTTARPAPQPANSAACAVIDGALYLVGGRTVGGGNLARLDRYDVKEDRWTPLAPMPRPAGGLAAAALDGKLYSFGGEWFEPGGGGGVYPEAFEYDPKTDGWRAIAPMKTPRHGLAAAAIGGKVYAIGGAAKVGGAETTNLLEAFTPG